MKTNELDVIIDKVEDLESFGPILNVLDDAAALESANKSMETSLEAAGKGFWEKVQEVLSKFWEKIKEVIRTILEKIGQIINQVRGIGAGKKAYVSQAAKNALLSYVGLSAEIAKADPKDVTSKIGAKDFDSAVSGVESTISHCKELVANGRKKFADAIKGKKTDATETVNPTEIINAAKKAKLAADGARKTYETSYKNIIAEQKQAASEMKAGNKQSDTYKNISKAVAVLKESVSVMVSYSGSITAMAYSLIANRSNAASKGEKKESDSLKETTLGSSKGAKDDGEYTENTGESWIFDFETEPKEKDKE